MPGPPAAAGPPGRPGWPGAGPRCRTRSTRSWPASGSRCAGCSQVKPIPPCSWTHSCAACTRRRRCRPPWPGPPRPAVGVAVGQAGGRVPGRGPGLGHAHPHVGQPVLEGLERADRAGELVPFLDVGDGHLQAPLGHAELLGGEQPAPAVRRARPPRRPRPRPLAIRLPGDLVQRHVGQLPGDVQGHRRGPGHSGAGGVHRVQADGHTVPGHQQHGRRAAPRSPW